MSLEKLIQITDKLLQSAIKLNEVFSGGKKLENFSQRELLEKITRQYHIAKEEFDETVKAIKENDVVEQYDGYVDVLVTVPYLLLLIDELGLFDEGDVDEYKELFDGVRDIFTTGAINLDLLDKCADLIIDNNASKYTTSKQEFDSWKTKYQRHSCEIDDVTYYYLLDENGKGRKHNNFKSVDLSFVLDEV